MQNFTGKTALVTGAGGYIGGEVALQLAKQGAEVAVCDILEERIAATVEKITAAGGRAKGYVIDVTDPADVKRAVTAASGDMGGLDISVHVAGGSARIAGPGVAGKLLTEQEDYVIDRVLKVNLYGAMYVAREAAKIMIARGRGGRIISFSSIVGTNGLAYCVDYAAAKAGVIGMTKALAKELAPHGITVNAVAPGVVMRPEENGGEERALGTNFLHKKCTADHVAKLVSFMVSEEAEFITGQAYIIDGGRSLAMKGTD